MDEQNSLQPAHQQIPPEPTTEVLPQSHVEPPLYKATPAQQVETTEFTPPQPALQPPATGLPVQPQQSNFSVSSVSSPKKDGTKKIVFTVIALIVLLLIVGGGVFAYLGTSKSSDTDSKTASPATQTNTQDDTPSATTDSQVSDITARANGELIKATLASFYNGGQVNDTQLPVNEYYPSTSEMKDATWTKKTLQFPDSVQSGLKKGTYVYTSTGCDGTKSSSKQNACSGFTITIKQSSGTNLELKND